MSGKTETDFSQAILEEAKQEADKIVDLARREAERILEGARAELDQIYIAEAPQAKKQQAATRYNQIIAAAELEARRQTLLARERFIQEVQAQVKRRLAQLREETSYPQLLLAVIRQGLAELNGETFEIIVAPEDRPLLNETVLRQLSQEAGKVITLSAHSQPGITGAIVQRSDQRVRCNNVLDAILQREQEEIRPLIARELFGEIEA